MNGPSGRLKRLVLTATLQSGPLHVRTFDLLEPSTRRARRLNAHFSSHVILADVAAPQHDVDDPCKLTVVHDFTSMEDVKRYMSLPNLKDLMQKVDLVG